MHNILFLSATIPSMDFYNPGLCDGLEFYDNSNKKDANLTEEDIQDEEQRANYALRNSGKGQWHPSYQTSF